MAINENRQTITYENIAMFESASSAHSGINNSGNNLSFLPFVQSLNLSFDIPVTNVGNLGAKSFVDQSSLIQPNVNLSVNTLETFENLFSGLFAGSGIRENLNTDRNFYAVLGDKKGFDVSKMNLSGAEVLSFGNCFLNDVTISQSVNGLMTSQYSYVGSNAEVQKLEKFELPEDPASVTSFTVSGSTESDQNGVYNHNGTLNGKKRWVLDANTEIVWNNSNNRWELRFFGTSFFSSSENTTYPWNATNWREDESTFGDIGFSIPQIFYTGIAPSVNLTGSQLKDEKVQFRPVSTGPHYYSTPKNAEDLGDYYSKSLSPDEQGGIIRRVPLHDKEKIIPYYKTNLTISNADLIAESDSIQQFSIQMPINRKTIYGLGKKFPIARKALFPNECVINVSNLLSNFKLTENPYGYVASDYPIVGSSLKNYLKSNETFDLTLLATDNETREFRTAKRIPITIKNAKLINQSYSFGIGNNSQVDLSFSFELNNFIHNWGSMSSFVYGGHTYTLSSALVSNKPSYIRDGGMVAWDGANLRWNLLTFAGFGGTRIDVIHNDDTDYPFLDLNGDLRSEFSNFVF